MKTYNRVFMLPMHAPQLDLVENNSDFTIIERKITFDKNSGGYSVYVRFQDIDDNRPLSDIPGSTTTPDDGGSDGDDGDGDDDDDDQKF